MSLLHRCANYAYTNSGRAISSLSTASVRHGHSTALHSAHRRGGLGPLKTPCPRPRAASQAARAARGATPDTVTVPPRSLPDIVGGWLNWAATLLFLGVPIWIAQGLTALLAVTVGNKMFFASKDRSAIKYKDPFPVEHSFIEVNGIKLHAVSARRGQGKPLMLFLHGFPELWFSWWRQMQEFQDEYEVVAIDMRGFGESDKPVGREHYVIPTLASDAAEVVKALGHDKCTLVGHDWGSMVAWNTAALYPERVERLIIMAVPHPIAWTDNLDLDQRRRSWYMIYFQAPWLPEFMLGGADFAFLDGAFKSGPVAPRSKGAISDDDIERYKQGFARPGARTASLNYYRSFFDYQTRWPSQKFRVANEVLRQGLPMPVLMLYAANDTALGLQLLKGTEKYVPDFELHVLEDCSHWVQQDQPERVHSLMRGFFERTTAKTGTSAPAMATAKAA